MIVKIKNMAVVDPFTGATPLSDACVLQDAYVMRGHVTSPQNVDKTNKIISLELYSYETVNTIRLNISEGMVYLIFPIVGEINKYDLNLTSQSGIVTDKYVINVTYLGSNPNNEYPYIAKAYIANSYPIFSAVSPYNTFTNPDLSVTTLWISNMTLPVESTSVNDFVELSAVGTVSMRIRNQNFDAMDNAIVPNETNVVIRVDRIEIKTDIVDGIPVYTNLNHTHYYLISVDASQFTKMGVPLYSGKFCYLLYGDVLIPITPTIPYSEIYSKNGRSELLAFLNMGQVEHHLVKYNVNLIDETYTNLANRRIGMTTWNFFTENTGMSYADVQNLGKNLSKFLYERLVAIRPTLVNFPNIDKIIAYLNYLQGGDKTVLVGINTEITDTQFVTIVGQHKALFVTACKDILFWQKVLLTIHVDWFLARLKFAYVMQSGEGSFIFDVAATDLLASINAFQYIYNYIKAPTATGYEVYGGTLFSVSITKFATTLETMKATEDKTGWATYI